MRRKMRIDDTQVEGMVFKIAQTQEELEQAFEILHDTYVQEGYMEPDPSGMRLSLFHTMPRTTTFVGVKNGRVITTLSIYADSFLRLPMDSLFKDVTDRARKQGRFVCEIGAFACRKGYKTDNPTVALHLMAATLRYLTRNLPMDDLFITVNPKHSAFYRHVMAMEQRGDQRAYSCVKGNPAVALHMDLRTIEHRLEQMYRSAGPSKDVNELVFHSATTAVSLPPRGNVVDCMTPRRLKYFFAQRTAIFEQSSAQTVKRILGLYTSGVCAHDS